REPSKGIRLKHSVTMIHSEGSRSDLTRLVWEYPRRIRRPGRRFWRARASPGGDGEIMMRQLLLLLLGRIRRGAPHLLRSGLPLVGLALVVVGCATPSLMPPAQAVAVRDRDRALAPHAIAIHTAIDQSGNVGALAFLDAKDGRLVVLPGDSPSDAWSSYATSPESGAGRISVPAVVTFVYRADVPKAPETVTQHLLEQQQAFRRSLASLETELRDADRHTEQRLGIVQRELAESIAATKQERDASL